jgi:hypothetical protein
MLTFHHLRDGKPSCVARVTNGALGVSHGLDRGRALVVTLEAGDLIVFRPKGTRQRLALNAFDAYSYAVRCAAMAKAREQCAAKAGRNGGES